MEHVAIHTLADSGQETGIRRDSSVKKDIASMVVRRNWGEGESEVLQTLSH